MTVTQRFYAVLPDSRRRRAKVFDNENDAVEHWRGQDGDEIVETYDREEAVAEARLHNFVKFHKRPENIERAKLYLLAAVEDAFDGEYDDLKDVNYDLLIDDVLLALEGGDV